MPTKYTSATEQMVLEEFRKKIDQEVGVSAFVKSESPDAIIHTQTGKSIGIEVTSAIRTDDSATNPQDKNKVAIFLNKYGTYDSSNPLFSTLSETFKGNSYVENLLSKIIERIQEKEANNTYCNFKIKFDKSVLAVYLDDMYLDSDTVKYITRQNGFSNLLHLFDEVYLFVRPTYHTFSSDIKQVGGFYLLR